MKIRKSNTGMFTQLISDARAAEWELVQPGDEDRLFYRLPWWKKVVVMAGGPTVNLADRVLPLLAVFATYGNEYVEVRPRSTRSSTASRRASCPPPRTARECTAADPVSPAYAGRPAARRPHRQLQRHRGHQLGPAAAS